MGAAFKPHFLWKGRESTRHGQNRTREIRPSGIVGRLGETWNMAEIGSRCTYRKSTCRSLSA